MTSEFVSPPALTGYKFYPHPSQKTLGVLQIDTLQGQSALYLVTKRNLLLLAEALAQEAEKLEGLQ